MAKAHGDRQPVRTDPAGRGVARCAGNLAVLGSLFLALMPPGVAVAASASGEPVAVLSGMPAFDGSAEAPPASLPRWRQMLHETRRLTKHESDWPTPAEMRARGRAASGGTIPIAVLDARWPDRAADGAATERDVFAAAALRPWTHRGARVEFRVDPALWIGDSRAAYRSVELDFDDGLGWREARLGGRITATWSATGSRHVRLRARREDGTVREAGFPFEVRALATPAADDTLRITATVPYLGTAGAADAYVYYGAGHTDIRNPVVVIEGFDLEDTYDWEELYAVLNQEGLLETLRAQGFDAVVVNFDQATDYLQRNAYVVVATLEQVNALRQGPGDVALVGASMGGLLSRYALAYMEQQAIDANVRTFVSFDAPQKGANIPLGIQYWLDFFSGQSTDAQVLLDLLDRPGARQMLLYHHTDPPGATGVVDPLRTAFLADLAALGDWPSVPRLVAVANGSGAGQNQGFGAGQQVIDYEYDSFLVDVIGNVWAVPDGGPTVIFDGKIDFVLLPAETMNVSVTGTLPWDSAPGGFRGSMATMDSTQAPFGDIVALYDNHCFVPTISALALNVTDPFHDVAGDPVLLSRTPFDAVYYPPTNQPHIGIDAASAAWFLAELGTDATAVAEATWVGALAALRLLPGGPNPFREQTTVRFQLDGPHRVTAQVFDVAGRRVDELLRDVLLPAGAHELRWPGAPGARSVTPGVYWVRLHADGARTAGRLVRID